MENTENMGAVPTPTKSSGALVGSIIIVIILILGGIYLLRNSLNEPAVPTNDLADSTAQTAGQDLGEIEGELNSMDLESLDSEI